MREFGNFCFCIYSDFRALRFFGILELNLNASSLRQNPYIKCVIYNLISPAYKCTLK